MTPIHLHVLTFVNDEKFRYKLLERIQRKQVEDALIPIQTENNTRYNLESHHFNRAMASVVGSLSTMPNRNGDVLQFRSNLDRLGKLVLKQKAENVVTIGVFIGGTTLHDIVGVQPIFSPQGLGMSLRYVVNSQDINYE